MPQNPRSVSDKKLRKQRKEATAAELAGEQLWLSGHQLWPEWSKAEN